MDEVDIDDVDDLNELEARLYAQIHHEPANTVEFDNNSAEKKAEGEVVSVAPTTVRTVTSTSVINKPVGNKTGRYWNDAAAASRGENVVKPQQQKQEANIQNNSQEATEGGTEPIDAEVVKESSTADGVGNASTNEGSSNLDKTNKSANATQNKIQVTPKAQTPKPKATLTPKITATVKAAPTTVPKATSIQKVTPSPKATPIQKAIPLPKTKPTPSVKSNIQNSNKNSDKRNLAQHQTQNFGEFRRDRNQKLNPANIRKQQQQHKEHLPAPYVNLVKNAPFSRQLQKLDKAKRIEAKRQKSKIVRSKNRQRKDAVETIVLESTNESEDDDVIAVPLPKPPIYTIDDSDEEKKPIIIKVLEEEEEEEEEGTKADIELRDIQKNTKDESDIHLEIMKKLKMAPVERDEEQAQKQNASRCNSPCSSVLSSDDFIGQNDRSRLEENTDMADDEDLIMLTADVDSLMEAPTTSKKAAEMIAKSKSSQQSIIEESSNDVECSQFIVPPANAKKSSKNQYRVEQSEFRALDVYESESDIADNVYARGLKPNKETIIRALSSSDDDDDNCVVSVVTLRSKTKRLRKRSISSRNKEAEPSVEGASTDSEHDICMGEIGTDATPVPFIARGPALERNSDTLSICTSRRASAGGASVGQMSDSEFIATLNNLAQAGNDENDADDLNSDYDEEDNIAAPSARAIAEQVLAASNKTQANTNVTENVAVEDDVEMETAEEVAATRSTNQTRTTQRSVQRTAAAVPDETMSHLSNIFETIDNMDKRKRTDVISDESEQEVEIVEDADLMTSPLNSHRPRLKMNKETGDPVYNIVYSEKKRLPGGLGWNDEMRRFYNDSWKGENFNVRNILTSMDANKNLWKIYTEDRFPKTRRFTNLKCYNCCEFGHTRAKCTQPRKPSTCYMCGERGHYEPRCPNTVCLRCGNKTHVFTKSCNACSFQNRLICPVCKVRGHTINLCPDKWRRYHSTTEPNKYPNSEVEYRRKKCCCVCGARGHLSDTCKSAVRFLEYPIVVSDIKSHQKSYSDQSFRGAISGIGLNLLYKPDQDVSFELAENTTKLNYYGRFLNAVGMGYLLKRKRKAKTLVPNTPSKQAKMLGNYVANPYSRAGQQARNTANPPEQVQEISESGNIESGPPDVEVVPEADAPPANTENIENSNRSGKETAETNESLEVIGTLTQEPMDQTNAFKAPEVIAVNAQAQDPSTKETDPTVQDSDSNYSFSEHYEMSCSAENESTDPTIIAETAFIEDSQNIDESTIADEPMNEITDDTEAGNTTECPIITPTQPRRKPREMEPLPDFIPLNLNDNNDDDNVDDDDDEFDPNLEVGISRKYVTAESDDEDAEGRATSPLPDLPCEAKIYLTHFHSKYLLSPEGHRFLVEKSKDCNIKARLDWTSVGHVLIIYGLQSNQDRFHRELLLKYRHLTDQMNKKDVAGTFKIPRRVDAIIRFLRENITMLMKNLGNVNDHMKRLKMIEHRPPSKNSAKLAEKLRRSLNMIILGQAGLRDGNFHLDKLLLSLQKLINEHKGDEFASNKLRDEIDSHWKVIFTPYRHDNYPELVQHYNKMLTKNRIPKLNIDPVLLGGSVLNMNVGAAPKEQKTPTPGKDKKRSSIVPNPLNPKNSKKTPTCSSPPPPAPSMRIVEPTTNIPVIPTAQSLKLNTSPLKSNRVEPTDFVPHTNLLKLKNLSQLQASQISPFANPQQKSTSVAVRIRETAEKWETTCNSLLSKINTGNPKKNRNSVGSGPERDCKAPSVFWSRESIKYLDECISRVASVDGGNLIEKLQRVQLKSQSGLLSYNDYRAVIRIHNTILGK